jgi:hypothetical protein
MLIHEALILESFGLDDWTLFWNTVPFLNGKHARIIRGKSVLVH